MTTILLTLAAVHFVASWCSGRTSRWAERTVGGVFVLVGGRLLLGDDEVIRRLECVTSSS
jgi:threonine/homoserine/homoserine lactone efflux protein